MGPKLLTVFGATGGQGGSVIASILSHPSLSSQFRLRAVTRNKDKPEAQGLAQKGVEVVQADLDNPETIKAAVKDSQAAFGITSTLWANPNRREIEVRQGKAIADACVAAGVKHLIWSSLPDVTALTEGKLATLSHFDDKAKVSQYIESIKPKSGGMITTHFMPGCFMANFLPPPKGMMIHKSHQEPDTLTLAIPWDAHKTQVPLFSHATDTGKFVAGILAAGAEDPSTIDGKSIHAVSEWMTPADISSTLSKKIDKKVVFQPIPEEVFESFLPSAMAREITDNMVLIRDYSYYGVGSAAVQAKEHDKVLLEGEKTLKWDEFIKENEPWEF